MPAERTMHARLRAYGREGTLTDRWVERWGENPLSIQIGNDWSGWDTYVTCGTHVLKELHAQIGAHLAKLAHEAPAQQ